MSVNKIPCKNFFCPRDRASGYLYCDKHKDGKEEIDDVKEAAKYTCRQFRQDERHIVEDTNHQRGTPTTLVSQAHWEWLIETMARAWDVQPERLENRVVNRLYNEYGAITYA